MGIDDDGSRAPRDHCPCILREGHHAAFDVYMSVRKSWTEEFSPHVHLLFCLIATNTHDGVPVYGNVGGIDLPGNDVDQFSIF